MEVPGLLPGSRHEPFCSALRAEMNEPRYVSRKLFAIPDSARTYASASGQIKENQMKSMKLYGVVLGSLVVLASSLPVWSQQETTQTTQTTTQTPTEPQTQTTQTRSE